MTESEAAPVLVLKSQTVAVSVPRSPHEFVCLVCSLHLPRWIRAHLFSPHKWNVAEEQPRAETRPGLWRSGWRRQGLHCVFTASSLRSLSVLLVRCLVSSWAGRDWVIYITGFLSERNTGSRCWGGTLLFSTPTSGEVFQSLAKIPCDYKNDKVSTKRRNMNHCSRKSPLCPVCQDASVLCGCCFVFFCLWSNMHDNSPSKPRQYVSQSRVITTSTENTQLRVRLFHPVTRMCVCAS